MEASMAEVVPKDTFDRLEREWRMIDPDRPTSVPKPAPVEAPKRLRITRVD